MCFFFPVYIEGHPDREQRGVAGQSPESERRARPEKHQFHSGQFGLLHRTISSRGEHDIFQSSKKFQSFKIQNSSFVSCVSDDAHNPGGGGGSH